MPVAISCAEIKSSYSDHYVPISGNAVIRTIVMEADDPTPSRPPLVMVHGFGAGLLQFYKNLDYLHGDRRLLAFDLPGFGRSTRVGFPRDPEGAEGQFVDAIEEWRQGMGVSEWISLSPLSPRPPLPLTLYPLFPLSLLSPSSLSHATFD